jgi:hypothetical protein
VKGQLLKKNAFLKLRRKNAKELLLKENELLKLKKENVNVL